MKQVIWKWGPGASKALQAKARYIDLEGGIRAQKTTALCAWVAIGAIEEPGSNAFLCRYLDHDLQTILKPKWREYCQQSGIPVQWNASEECDEINVGGKVSKVYLKGLKASEGAQMFSKLRGPTLARFGIDQAEELPAAFWPEVKGRLSQPGYTQQAMLTPQPVNPDHWIAKEFPEHNPDPSYLYIRTNCYDNRVNLGDAYIAELEKAYPEGSAERRTLLEGRRGLALSGEPVYKGAFSRARHIDPKLGLIQQVPLLEGWDYGHHHPCVVWAQVYAGRLSILGAVMGQSISIDQFAPVVLEIRRRWFGQPMDVWTTGDPAGMAASSQGLPVTLRTILAEFGIHISAIETANRPEVRDQAIKTIASYMSRTALDGQPAFRLNPRAILITPDGVEEPREFLADAFEAGYVWDTRLRTGTVAANVRRPKKDGYYDHCLVGSTMVDTADGPKAIETLVGQSGQVRTAYGAWAQFTHAALTQRDAEIVRVTFEDGRYVDCTPDHRFLSLSGWVLAKDMAGQECQDAISGGYVKCASVEPLDERQDVYCLRVPVTEAFCVANGLVVHNSMNCSEYLALAYGAGTVTERTIEAAQRAQIRADQREERDKAAWDRRGQYGRRGGY